MSGEKRRWVLCLILTGMLRCGPVALGEEDRGPAGKKTGRPTVERFLPQSTLLFVSLPDAVTLQGLLDTTGDTRKALASRLAGEDGVGAGSLGVVLEILTAAADGPVTFSLHREVVPGAPPRTPFLVSASTRRKGDHLRKAAGHFLRGLLVPKYAESVREERLMGVPVLHLSRPGLDLYFSHTRGFLLYSDSPLLLGWVLREMQGGPAGTLALKKEFESARTLVRNRAGGRPHGFLYLGDPALLPALGSLGVRSARGMIVRTGEGIIDTVTLRVSPGGPLGLLRAGGEIPGAWSGARGTRCWLGATLEPAGVRGLLLAVLGPEYEIFLGGFEKAATGAVEALLSEEGTTAIRVALVPGADVSGALDLLDGASRREGDVLLVCGDPETLSSLTAGAERAWSKGGGGGIKGPVGLFLQAFGADGAAGSERTAWRFRPVDGGNGDKEVEIIAGKAEIGPLRALIASLFR